MQQQESRAPVNPYAAPSSTSTQEAPESGGRQVLAPREARFVAALFDGILVILTLVPAMVLLFQEGLFQQSAQSGQETSPFWWVGTSPGQLFSMVAYLGLIGLQAYLVTTGGQSIGKRLLGIKIVKTDGRPVGFMDGVFLRTWLLALLGYVPILGKLTGFVGFIDALFIFRADQRCLHDLIAGTKVIRHRR